MMDTTYNVGIYCRLSNDDERDGESVSIENQKLLLQNYVRQRGWNEVDVYIDDGYSGTNFNRPGVRRLIEDAKAKRINVILVKDLSRFGRNYIEFGQYTDYLLVLIYANSCFCKSFFSRKVLSTAFSSAWTFDSSALAAARAVSSSSGEVKPDSS